jgi:hypothetical protein
MPYRVRVSALLGHAPHCSPITDINTEQTSWVGVRQRRLHLESGGGGGCTGAPAQQRLLQVQLKWQWVQMKEPLLWLQLQLQGKVVFSLLLSVFNLQRFAACCINCLLIAHCRDCCSLTMTINESVGSTAAPVHMDDYDSMADPK